MESKGLRRLENETSRYWLTGRDSVDMESRRQLESRGEAREAKVGVVHEAMEDMLVVLAPAGDGCFVVQP